MMETESARAVVGSGPTPSSSGGCGGDEEWRWEAVSRRDRSADGLFCYSVRTTGVYCRPSCSSRLPRRENVRFHDDAADAERLGFRPCKRCRPDPPRRDAASDSDGDGDGDIVSRRAEAVAIACRMIETANEPPSLDALAEAVGLSRFHFHRVFTAQLGVTPKAYADAWRARRVREALAGASTSTVTEAIHRAGFASSGRFYEVADEVLGMSPTSYRSGGAGVEMRFAVGECWLGSILVAATSIGVCAILLGDDPDALARELQDRFPNARLIGGDPEFERVVAQVVAFVEAPALGLDLPLDIRGAAFQQRVWQALCRIPPGSTASYAEIARKIGRPSAVRAVANACAANHLAVAIPCHRVLRSDGSLSGYRWGVERKRALLDREAEQSRCEPAAPSPLALE